MILDRCYERQKEKTAIISGIGDIVLSPELSAEGETVMRDAENVGQGVTVKEMESIILQEKENLKIHEYAFVASDQVVFSDDVRKLCERNACGMYGKSWACPPAVGSVADCKSQCDEFQRAFVFTSMAEIKNKYDVNGWREAGLEHERRGRGPAIALCGRISGGGRRALPGMERRQ